MSRPELVRAQRMTPAGRFQAAGEVLRDRIGPGDPRRQDGKETDQREDGDARQADALPEQAPGARRTDGWEPRGAHSVRTRGSIHT